MTKKIQPFSAVFRLYKKIDFVQLYGRQKIEAAVSPLKALIPKSKLCFLHIKFPLRSQFKICLHLIESGQQDNL